MGNSNIPKHISERLKQIVGQVSGKIEDDTLNLIPEYKIKGTGAIYCLLTDNRSFIKVERGISVYIIEENYGYYNKSLVYSLNGDIILIDFEELEEIGFD